jgi:hypothetical protein
MWSLLLLLCCCCGWLSCALENVAKQRARQWSEPGNDWKVDSCIHYYVTVVTTASHGLIRNPCDSEEFRSKHRCEICWVQLVKCQDWIDTEAVWLRPTWLLLCWFLLFMPMVKVVAYPLISYCCMGHRLRKSIFHVVRSIAVSNLVWWHSGSDHT